MKNLLFSLAVTAGFLYAVHQWLDLAPEYVGRGIFAFLVFLLVRGFSESETQHTRMVGLTTKEAELDRAEVSKRFDELKALVMEIRDNPIVELKVDSSPKRKNRG